MSKKIIIPIFLFLTLSIHISANDGAIGLDGGDLSFKNLKGVVMEKEWLYLSFDKVEVRYEFKNKTKKDIETLVGFPIKWVDDCGDKNFDANSDNPLNFTATVNGKVVKTELKKTGFEKLKDDECGLKLEMTYYWKQIFKAGSVTEIKHTYQPVYSSSVEDLMGPSSSRTERLVKGYCSTEKQLNRLQKKGILFRELLYILQTAKTWDGPIGDFELIIDKGKASLVSLCTDLKIEKVKGKNQFRAKAKNFIPKRDLNLLFVLPEK